jgi:DNA-3-methyladenine glycosylase II
LTRGAWIPSGARATFVYTGGDRVEMRKDSGTATAKLTLAHPGATRRALRHLRRTDLVLGKLIAQIGPCGYQMRTDGAHFDHLVRAIVYQQLAGKAAATIYGRVQALYGGRPPTPAELAGTTAARLRRAGLSRQKLGYLKDLARRVASGRLALDALDSLPDEAVIEALTAIRGVGVWTAQMFLMFRLGRLDVLPVLDLGIQKGMRRTYALRRMPKPAQMERIAAGWSPYRSVACWYLWRAAELPAPAPRVRPARRA